MKTTVALKILSAAALLVGAQAAPARAASWVEYYSTVFPLPMPVPTFITSSFTATQAISAVDLLQCSGGVWTKYINIRTATDVLHSFQGTACGIITPGHTDFNTKSLCGSLTSGTWYAKCWVLT